MSKIIEDRYGDVYKTPGFWSTTGAIATGYLVDGVIVRSPQAWYGTYFSKNLKKNAESIDSNLIKRVVSDAFESSGLRKNNVELVDASKQVSHEQLYEYCSKEFPKFMRNTRFFKENLIKPATRAVETGNNALYARKSGKVIVNVEKLGIAAFHEMGHAINHNQSRFWRALQSMRTPLTFTTVAIPLIALGKRKKVEGEQPKNNVDRVTTFIKNNVGKLTTLAFLPIVAEELKATQRGNKLAAKLLSPDVLKNVKNTNKLGAASYILIAISSGLGASIANKVRDKMASPKKID